MIDNDQSLSIMSIKWFANISLISTTICSKFCVPAAPWPTGHEGHPGCMAKLVAGQLLHQEVVCIMMYMFLLYISNVMHGTEVVWYGYVTWYTCIVIMWSIKSYIYIYTHSSAYIHIWSYYIIYILMWSFVYIYIFTYFKYVVIYPFSCSLFFIHTCVCMYMYVCAHVCICANGY